MRLITSLIALLSIRLVTAIVSQDILENKGANSTTGIINVNSTCGDIRATSMSITPLLQLFLTFYPQKRSLHFPDPMVISTGWTVASKPTMDGNRPISVWKTSSPIHSPALLQSPRVLSKHALNIFGSSKNMVVSTTSPQSSWLLLPCKKARVSLMLLAVVVNKVWCRSPVRNVLVLQIQVVVETLCATFNYNAFYSDTHTSLRNLISAQLPDISLIPWKITTATCSWVLARTTVGIVDWLRLAVLNLIWYNK